VRLSTANRVVVLLLAALLVIVSLAKLWSGWLPEYWVPAWLYHGLLVGELVAAAGLYGGTRWRARTAQMVLWLVGVALLGTTVSRGEGRCGCLGEMAELGNLQRIGLLALMGVLALLVLWTEGERRAVQSELRNAGQGSLKSRSRRSRAVEIERGP
jgi:hypothetical protein